MDFKKLQKGVVGDLGSKSENETISSVTIRGSGTEEGLLEYAHSRYRGMTILDERVESKDGKMTYTARIKSLRGIPFFSDGSKGKDRVLLADKAKDDPCVCAFGDVVLVTPNGDPYAFGDA